MGVVKYIFSRFSFFLVIFLFGKRVLFFIFVFFVLVRFCYVFLFLCDEVIGFLLEFGRVVVFYVLVFVVFIFGKIFIFLYFCNSDFCIFEII